MALTPSNMLPLGTIAPNFELINTNDNKPFLFQNVENKTAYCIFFICNHCPYVKYVKNQLIALYQDYHAKNIAFIAINSNDFVAYPEDNPEKMKAENYPFPYLIDESQQVAKLYDAACTPDLYIFDKEKKLVYRGQLDDARPGNQQPNDGKDVRNAFDEILKGNSPTKFQKPSVGCNIKWKK